jgi:N-acetylglutamate synthase-like GNAT family acetyltransferase
MTIRIRAAAASDAEAIRALVRSEALNPFGLDWPNFVVADRGGRVVGTVQLRPLGTGAAELASLAVRRQERGQGLAARLIEAALGCAPERVLVITAAATAPHYRRWGFVPAAPGALPGPVRLHRAIGRAVTLVFMLRGRAPRRLVVLERRSATWAAAA